jgi:hypothetical protein
MGLNLDVEIPLSFASKLGDIVRVSVNEGIGSFIQKWLRISQHQQQAIKPSIEAIWAQAPLDYMGCMVSFSKAWGLSGWNVSLAPGDCPYVGWMGIG